MGKRRVQSWLPLFPDRRRSVMSVLLADWQPFHTIALTGVVGLSIVIICLIEAWQQSKKVQADAALKRELLDRGLSAADVERLVQLPKDPPTRLAHKLGKSLAYLTPAQPGQIEEVLAAFREADLATRQTLVRLVDGMVNELDEVTENDAARIVA